MQLPTSLSWSAVTILLAASGTIVATWKQILGFLNQALSLIIVRASVKGDLSIAVQSYIWTRGKRSPFGSKVFGGTKNYVHPNRRIEVIGYETISSDPLLVWFNKRPAIIKRMTGNQTYNSNLGTGTTNSYTGSNSDDSPLHITFLRGTFNLENFLNKVIENYNEIHHKENIDRNNKSANRFQVIRLTNDTDKKNQPAGSGWNVIDVMTLLKTNSARLIKWTKNDLLENIKKSAFEDYPFPKEAIDILEEIKLWKENSEFFKFKGIPWRRGYTLAGIPGSGKSTLIRAIGRDLDMPIYVFDLARETNVSFVENFQKVQASSPAIALIEDIDSIFEGRINLSQGLNPKESLTFDCLLNTISGVGNSDGVLLFITTNNIEKLDPALGVVVDGKSSRPGRIDKILFLNTMQEPERCKLAHLILDKWPELIDNIVAEGEGETAAQFQDRCAQLALKKFWETNNK